MLESKAVAHCPKCAVPFHGDKPFVVPIFPPQKGDPVTEFRVYPSGCRCGEYTVIPLEKFKKRPWK